MAEVRIGIGDQELVAVITRSSAERLRLEVGESVYAVIKSTEVMIGKGTADVMNIVLRLALVVLGAARSWPPARPSPPRPPSTCSRPPRSPRPSGSWAGRSSRRIPA